MMISITNYASGNPWVALAIAISVLLLIGFNVGFMVGRKMSVRAEKRWLWNILQQAREAELFNDLDHVYGFLEAVLDK